MGLYRIHLWMCSRREQMLSQIPQPRVGQTRAHRTNLAQNIHTHLEEQASKNNQEINEKRTIHGHSPTSY